MGDETTAKLCTVCKNRPAMQTGALSTSWDTCQLCTGLAVQSYIERAAAAVPQRGSPCGHRIPDCDCDVNRDLKAAVPQPEISDERLAKALDGILGKGIEAIWLRRRGGEDGHIVEVLAQMDGEWYVAIKEDLRSNFSHSAHLCGAYNWPLDDITATPPPESAQEEKSCGDPNCQHDMLNTCPKDVAAAVLRGRSK